MAKLASNYSVISTFWLVSIAEQGFSRRGPCMYWIVYMAVNRDNRVSHDRLTVACIKLINVLLVSSNRAEYLSRRYYSVSRT